MAVFQVRQVLNEVYFGKTPAIKALISQLGKFRRSIGVEAIASNHKSKAYAKPTDNSNKELTEFNRMMENEFGFKTFCLCVVTSSEKNLYTYPIGLNFDVIGSQTKKNLTFSKDGFRYLKKANYSVLVCLTSAALYDEDITDDELFALIMHEVGHNFTSALSGSTMSLIGVRKFIMIFNIFIDILRDQSKVLGSAKAVLNNSNAYKTVRNKFNASLDKSGLGRLFKGAVNSINMVIDSISDAIGQIAFALTTLLLYHPITQIIAMISTIPSGLSTLLGGVRDEQIADSFAGMYGLGPELLRCVDKLSYGKHSSSITKMILVDSPFIGQMTDIIWFPVNAVAGVFDSHPTNAERYRNQLALLRRELEDNHIDPKMRKVIHEEINEIERQFDETYRNLNETEDPHYYTKNFQKCLYDNYQFGGGKSEFFQPDDNFEDIENASKTAIQAGKGGIIGKGLSGVKFK